MKTAIELIAEERERQINEEGWTPEHDDAHSHGELELAAASYAALAGGMAKFPKTDIKTIKPPRQWPWDEEWWKPADNKIRNLVKAGALLAAAIDREQRKEAKP